MVFPLKFGGTRVEKRKADLRPKAFVFGFVTLWFYSLSVNKRATMRSGTERTRNNGTRRSCASLRNLLLLTLVTVTGFILSSSDMPNISLSAMQTKMKNELDIDGSVSKNVDVSESPTTSRTIKQISIIGERNSGTRWTFE